MLTISKTTYRESLQKHVDEYVEETGRILFTTAELGDWAIKTGRWEPPLDLALRQCRHDYSRAIREQYIKNEAGQPVRSKHSRRTKIGDRQQYLWGDIESAPREHIESSFNQRREQIVGECRQLDRDKEYWNDKNLGQLPIQLVFDFTDDVEEGRYPGEYPPKKPR